MGFQLRTNPPIPSHPFVLSTPIWEPLSKHDRAVLPSTDLVEFRLRTNGWLPACTRGVMGFWLYVLRCSDGSYYIGQTDDLEKRIGQHQAGQSGGYTKSRRPVEVVFVECFERRDEALERERQLKGWSRTKKEALVAGDWNEVSRLARSGWRRKS